LRARESGSPVGFYPEFEVAHVRVNSLGALLSHMRGCDFFFAQLVFFLRIRLWIDRKPARNMFFRAR
jgi:hypothetical protein